MRAEVGIHALVFLRSASTRALSTGAPLVDTRGPQKQEKTARRLGSLFAVVRSGLQRWCAVSVFVQYTGSAELHTRYSLVWTICGGRQTRLTQSLFEKL
ncbi:hypothetical protein C8J57DRAFT_1334007, partial [Mycena rebaudengoi]